MRAIAVIPSISLLLMTLGCADRDHPTPAEIAGFAKAQEKFRARATFENPMQFKTTTSFENGVISIEAPREGGSPRTLMSAAHHQYEWALYLPPPPLQDS